MRLPYVVVSQALLLQSQNNIYLDQYIIYNMPNANQQSDDMSHFFKKLLLFKEKGTLQVCYFKVDLQ